MQGVDILEKIAQVLNARKTAPAAESYVAALYAQGCTAILDKVREETAEICTAAHHESKRALVHETADLWFHCMVLLAYRDVHLHEVFAELARRFGVSGHAEKRQRMQTRHKTRHEM